MERKGHEYTNCFIKIKNHIRAFTANFYRYERPSWGQ